MSWFTCVRETAKIINGPKKGPGGWKSGIGTQKAKNGEVLKASQKVKATCKYRHPDSSRRHMKGTKGCYSVVTTGYMRMQALGVYFKGKEIKMGYK